MVNTKTTAVRVIPAIGKKSGDTLNFGGLLGGGPVMGVNPASPLAFCKTWWTYSGSYAGAEKLIGIPAGKTQRGFFAALFWRLDFS